MKIVVEEGNREWRECESIMLLYEQNPIQNEHGELEGVIAYLLENHFSHFLTLPSSHSEYDQDFLSFLTFPSSFPSSLFFLFSTLS